MNHMSIMTQKSCVSVNFQDEILLSTWEKVIDDMGYPILSRYLKIFAKDWTIPVLIRVCQAISSALIEAWDQESSHTSIQVCDDIVMIESILKMLGIQETSIETVSVVDTVYPKIVVPKHRFLNSNDLAELSRQKKEFQCGVVDTTTYLQFPTPDGTAALQLLQALRYPKRYCPPYVDLKDDSIKLILATNNVHKVRCHTNFYSRRLVRDIYAEMRAFIAQYLRGAENDVDPRDFAFTSGSSLEGSKTLLEKVGVHNTFTNNLSGIPYPDIYSGRPLDQRARLVAVPKDYKGARPIAPESVSTNPLNVMIRGAIRRAMRRNNVPIHYDDQDINRRAVEEGSRRGTYASIDLHAASDGISCEALQAVMPGWVLKYRPTEIIANGKTYTNYIGLTSGNPNTWDLEGCYFLAVTDYVRARRIRYDAHFGERHNYRRAIVYGDDLVVDTRLYKEIVETLETLGHVVNESKSYDGHFRESCGKDYFNGIDVSSQYFPRKPMSFLTSKDKISFYRKNLSKGEAFIKPYNEHMSAWESVISLQHNLYYRSPSAADYLEGIVLSHIPRMTMHTPGTDCSDLWGFLPPRQVCAPIGEIIDNKMVALDRRPVNGTEPWAREQHAVLINRPRCRMPEFYQENDSDRTVYALDTYGYMRSLAKGGMSTDDPCFVWIAGQRYGLTEPALDDAARFGTYLDWVLTTE